MKALKVLYRDAQGQLWSALPTLCRLQYSEDGETHPDNGRLLVYLRSDFLSATCLCSDASTWYRTVEEEKGQMEVWEVECHNLYRMFYIVHAGDLQPFVEADFWRKIRTGLLGADGRDRATRGIGMVRYMKAQRDMWSTDWLRLTKQLGVYKLAGVWLERMSRTWAS